MSLEGKSIAILIAPRGTEEPEFSKPKEAVEQAGAVVTVISLETGEAKTNNNDLDPGGSYTIDKTFDEVSANDFDGLVIPGGCVGADKLRASKDAIAFVQAFFEQKKPVGVICHGPWLLVEADIVSNRTLTSFPACAPISRTPEASGSTRRSWWTMASLPAASQTICRLSAPNSLRNSPKSARSTLKRKKLAYFPPLAIWRSGGTAMGEDASGA